MELIAPPPITIFEDSPAGLARAEARLALCQETLLEDLERCELAHVPGHGYLIRFFDLETGEHLYNAP